MQQNYVRLSLELVIYEDGKYLVQEDLKMGSFRVGIGLTKCPKCKNDNCIVDVWDEDYEGIKEQFYCPKCNERTTYLFLRQYINAKLWHLLSHCSNSITFTEEEKLAEAMLKILNYDDDGNWSHSDLLHNISGIKEFKLSKIFDMQEVRDRVYNQLKDRMKEINNENKGI